ncbi:uncharacterized protein LOC133181954 [Saccostrea echinata]|uniref:uncharacterized protein LOC133181954 n=1 Tax=Saccostrea echinata TaxID=191078 RepID=UPI002A82DF4B|nr:uncharacterized protein LOC133181954 [Saccostrea echinata]
MANPGKNGFSNITQNGTFQNTGVSNTSTTENIPDQENSNGRPVLRRDAQPANVDINFDTSALFGENSLSDILGHGEAKENFEALLQSGQGEDGSNVKKFLESAGIPASAMEPTQQEGGNPFGMGGSLGGMSGMGGGGGMGALLGGGGGSIMGGGGGGYIPQSAMSGSGLGGGYLPPSSLMQGNQSFASGTQTRAPTINGNVGGYSTPSSASQTNQEEETVPLISLPQFQGGYIPPSEMSPDTQTRIPKSMISQYKDRKFPTNGILPGNMKRPGTQGGHVSTSTSPSNTQSQSEASGQNVSASTKAMGKDNGGVGAAGTDANTLHQTRRTDSAGGIQGSSGVGGQPRMGGLPGMSGQPGLGGLSGMNRQPGMGGLSGMNAQPGLGGLSGMNRQPGMGGLSGMGGVPRMGGLPGVSGNTAMSGMPGGGMGMQGSGQDYVQQIMEEERNRANECTDSVGQGLNTMIILDNSANMYGQSVEQAKEFIERFLEGLEDNAMDYGLEENVALITCGGSQPKVEQHLTNEYQCLRNKLPPIQVHGTNNLSIALFLVIGAIERAFEMIIGNHSIRPRILLLSNGKFSSRTNMMGMKGAVDQSQELSQMVELMQSILRQTNMKLFFVPVGDASEDIKSLMQNIPGVKVLDASNLKGVTRTVVHHYITGNVKEEARGGAITREIVKNVAMANYSEPEEWEIDEVMELLREDQEHDARRQDRRHQQGQMGMGRGMLGGRGGFTPDMMGAGLSPGMSGGGIPGLGGSGMPGLGRSGMSALGGGRMSGLGGGGIPGLGGSGMPGLGGNGMSALGGGRMPGLGGGGMPGLGGCGMPGLGGGGMPGLGGGSMPGLGGGGMPGLGGGGMPGLGGGGMPGLGGGGMPGMRGGGGLPNNTNLQSLAGLGISPGSGPRPNLPFPGSNSNPS